MKKVLFTKGIDTIWLRENLTENLGFEIVPFLEIKSLSSEHFISKIDPNSNRFIISSQNAVKAISNLNLEGEFFVVGQNTAKKLTKNNSKVVHFKHYASELGQYIVQNYEPQIWNFFCGNTRRDTLFEILIPNGHQINEMICYESTPKDLIIETGNFDALVFFSPLAVKTFFSKNQPTEKSIIFSIGNTTTAALKNYTNNQIINSDIPTKEDLINKINQYYDSEK